MANNTSAPNRKSFILIAIVVFALSIFAGALFFMFANNRDKPEANVVYKAPSQEVLENIRNKQLGNRKLTIEKRDKSLENDFKRDDSNEQLIKELSDTTTDNTLVDTDNPLIDSDSDVKVSPHGFGAYPKLPDKWPKDYWDRPKTREQEIIGRVRIKLYNEGKWADGITIDHDSGLVYPIYRDTIYIRWGAFTALDGTQKKYIRSARGHPETMKRIKKYRFLENISQLKDGVFPDSFAVSEQDLPSDINFVSYEEGAIDPMKYLGFE